MKNYMDASQQYPNMGSERASVIDKLNPHAIIRPIFEQLLGIRTITSRDNAVIRTISKRYNKPLFTEEFVRLLEHMLYGYVNDVTSFTKYSEVEIRERVKNIGIELNTLLAIKGDEGYVSEDVWKTIIQIHKTGTEIVINGKTSFKSGWTKFNIDWNYDEPVTFDMISAIKDFDELVDQEVIFSTVSNQCRRLIESCYKRSTTMPKGDYGMMTDLIGQTHMERTSFSQSPQEQSELPSTTEWK